MREKSSKPRAGNYEVGKGRPPRSTRWKPGQSGNSKGRPKGAKSFKTILQDALNQLLHIQEKGRTRKITAREAIVRRLVNQALKGDLKAIAQLFAMPEMTRPTAPLPGVTMNMTLEEAAEAYRRQLKGVE
jgi:hypothetical protein